MEYYHMTEDKYIREIIQEDGLQPRNGPQSQSIGDSKKVVFYSQGKEGAIVMYLSFEKMYEDLKGERGNKVLSRYKDYLDGKLELSQEDFVNLENQVKKIKAIRSTEKFSDHCEDGPYFSIQNLDVEEIDDKDFNFANSWVTKSVPLNNLQVVSLRNRATGQVTASKFDVIKHMMSQTTPEVIADMRINDKLADYIKRYYEENASDISRFGSDYEVEMMSIQEYNESLENRRAEQGIEQLSGQTIGQGVFQEIKNTKEIEAIALQSIRGNEQKDIEGKGE